MPELDPDLAAALGRGDTRSVAELIAAGADIHRKDADGYGALLRAVHGRDVARDAHLLDLLRLLIAQGADLNGISRYRESPLRVLSHVGRFDAVALLLAAGADKSQLRWTPLIEAVALGSLADVERLSGAGADLEGTDWWSRTAWLVALLTGNIDKAKLLRERGANVDARGRCAAPALHYAIEGHHPEMVRWLIGIGQDVNHKADFGITPLMEAVEAGDLECVDALVAAGADVDHVAETGSVLGQAETAEVARRLLDAGADPRHLSHEARRALCGLGPVSPSPLAHVSMEQHRRAATRVFGRTNPERMQEPYWEAMIRAGVTAFESGQAAGFFTWPGWCAQRFGQSFTFLPDGRIVQVGGEHEDHYDDDFCIYNDVFVHGPDGTIAIYGYPEAVFPPTDFHTATLMDDGIYVVGSLGYHGTRRLGETPIYRLDLPTLRMERVDAAGEAPGWIFQHRAARAGKAQIRVWAGKIATAPAGKEVHEENTRAFVLDVERGLWRSEP
jgi:ankyrin repeat protein